MKILIGVDMSYNSPGIVCSICDDKFEIQKKAALSFTKTKKYSGQSSDTKIIHYKDTSEDLYDSTIDHIIEYREEILTWMSEFISQNHVDVAEVWVAFEDYAFSATGQVFKLAEACGALKIKFFELGYKIRLYDPPTIKLFASGMGNSDKIAMEHAYNKVKKEDKLDLDFLPLVQDKKAGNPKDNLIDAFYIMKQLQLELKVRAGLLELKNLDENQRRVFLRVTKSNPINLLEKPFMEKNRA